MGEYNINDTVRLADDVRPVGTVSPSVFEENVEDGEYWGVPVAYFSVEMNDVYLDSRLATQLRWTVDGVMPGMLNIAALPDKVEVDGNEVSVNPGFWCSNIPKDSVL